MSYLRTMALVVASVFILSTVCFAQSIKTDRRIQEDKRRDLELLESMAIEGESRLSFDYGGWINYRYDDYTDIDNNSALRDSLDFEVSLDSRFWFMAKLGPPEDAGYENEHTFYLRLKNLFLNSRPKDVNGGYDNDGPHVDYLYMILDIRPYWLEFGRRYFSIGQGIAHGDTNDGIEFTTIFQDWLLRSFVSHTLPHADNIDTSIPGYDKQSDRTFYAFEINYLGFADQEIYSYYLAQKDDSEANIDNLANKFTYSSQYLGVGAQGQLASNLFYWAEIIRETGTSYIYTGRKKRDIEALAGDFGISYNADIYSHPNFTFEYAFATGDSSRVSVTDTNDGNADGQDTGFLYFGYLPTGYALSPMLSNLHFFRTGIFFRPFEDVDSLKTFSVSIDYYRYYKDKSTGGIYDLEATNADSYVGDELDLMLSSEITSDVSWSLQYGYFFPGDAYPVTAKDAEQYFAVDFTVIF